MIKKLLPQKMHFKKYLNIAPSKKIFQNCYYKSVLISALLSSEMT